MKTASPRFKRLSILAVLDASETYDSGLFSILRSHFVLVCQSVTQAFQAVPSIAPDVVLLDLNVPGAALLAEGLSAQNTAYKPLLVALRSSWSEGTLPAGFDYEVCLPFSSNEIATLLPKSCNENQADCYLVRSSA